MKRVFLTVLSTVLAVVAHTTIQTSETASGKATVKIMHFHPTNGGGLMGLKLGGEDTKDVKIINNVYYIHKGDKFNLKKSVSSFSLKNSEGSAPELSVQLDKNNGFRRGGDYIVVSKHIPHLKEGKYYIQLVTKSFLNRGGFLTDWPNRVLDSMPEIIPLVNPNKVYEGDIFRGYIVNDNGEPISHGELHIEFLNYEIYNDSIGSEPKFENKNFVERVIFSNNDGSFSFIPNKKGVWSITLLDGDKNRSIGGENLIFNSLITLEVK